MISHCDVLGLASYGEALGAFAEEHGLEKEETR